jgi:hypothetical protein
MKVNQALLCLSCDELFIGNECPICLSIYYFPLRKWLPPLHSFKEIQEAKNAKKTSDNKTQKESEKSIYIVNNIDNAPLSDPYKRVFGIEDVPKNKQERPTQNNSDESFKPKIGESYNFNGERMESESGLFSRSGGPHAGASIFRKVLHWLDKKGFILPRKEHTNRM